MNLKIFSLYDNIEYNKINFIKIFIKNKNKIFLKNHINNICNIDKILIEKNRKFFCFIIKNGILIQKKNLTKIFCNKYELL